MTTDRFPTLFPISVGPTFFALAFRVGLALFTASAFGLALRPQPHMPDRRQSLLFAHLDLLKRVIDQPGIIFLREITLQQLRCEQHCDVCNFVAYLLYGLPGLQLDLLLRVRRILSASFLCLCFEFLSQALGVGRRLSHDRLGLYTCLLHNLC